MLKKPVTCGAMDPQSGVQRTICGQDTGMAEMEGSRQSSSRKDLPVVQWEGQECGKAQDHHRRKLAA